jgi:dolichol-phosphate mannosyltransferase
MPVYNEQDTIAETVGEWATELNGRDLDYELLVYDDGSRDDSGHILEALRVRIARMTVRRQVNRGHGPTVLRGYREAQGEWIFQADSDGEVAPAGFHALWDARNGHDFLLGVRQGRRSPPARKVVTFGAQLTTWALFGNWIRDVNAPFRLMRRAGLAPLLPMLPADCFAPNVALTGLAARAGLRLCTLPVPHRPSRSSSLCGPRLWRAASRAWWQTLLIAQRARRMSRA